MACNHGHGECDHSSALDKALTMSRPALITNARRRRNVDPTRTTTLQNAFTRATNKRLNKLQADLIASVKTNNAFGLRVNQVGLGSVNPQTVLNPGQFANERDTQKLADYETYVENLILAVLLFGGNGTFAPFTDEWIDESFQRGSNAAVTNWEKAGGTVPNAYSLGPLALRTPLTDQAGMAKKRAYDAFYGDAIKLQNRLSFNFGQALTANQTPAQAADGIRSAITTAKKQFETTAKTEVVRAFNMGNIGQLEQLGVQEVTVTAEWKTAGDDRVCEACQSLEGKIFPIDVIRGLIPLHPRCRCMANPIINTQKKVTTLSEIPEAAERYITNKLLQNQPEPLQGEPGQRGARGFDGSTGKDGKDGKRGPRGFDGGIGETGAQGEKGERGERGIRGFDGATGKDGRDGIDGKDGKDGIDGQDGRRGRIGPRGMPGTQGRDGRRGRIGPRPDHEFKVNEDGSSQIRFQKPNGDWGDWTTLRTNEVTATPDGLQAYEYDGGRLRFKTDGKWGKWISLGGGGGTTGIIGVDIEQDGSTILEAATSLNFSGGVTVTDEGDGTASIQIADVAATYLNYFHIIQDQVVTIPDRVQSLISGERLNEGELVINGEAVEI